LGTWQSNARRNPHAEPVTKVHEADILAAKHLNEDSPSHKARATSQRVIEGWSTHTFEAYRAGPPVR